MDLGIAGRNRAGLRGEQGTRQGCAAALAREGVAVTILARGRDALEATAAELRAASGATVTAVAATSPRPRDARPRSRPARRPTSWSTTPAAAPGDFREWDEAAWQAGGQRQHGDADHADPFGGRRHDRAALRAHRQHHLGGGEVADPASRLSNGARAPA
jgi:hypothetical protein